MRRLGRCARCGAGNLGDMCTTCGGRVSGTGEPRYRVRKGAQLELVDTTWADRGSNRRPRRIFADSPEARRDPGMGKLRRGLAKQERGERLRLRSRAYFRLLRERGHAALFDVDRAAADRLNAACWADACHLHPV